MTSAHCLALMRRVVLPLGLAATACGGGTEGGPTGTTVKPVFSGRFNLTIYEGKPLPDTTRVIGGVSTIPGSTDFFRCPEVLLGATLDVAEDSTFRRTSRFAYPCTGTLPRPSDLPDSLTRVETGHEIIAGDSVGLSFDSSTPGAPPTSVEYAHISSGALVVYLVRTGVNLGSVELLANARVYQHE